MLFDAAPAELPVATLRSRRGSLAAFAGEVSAWFAARWAWLRPRTVPVLAGLAGAIAIIWSAQYLSHMPAPPLPHSVDQDTVHAAPHAVHLAAPAPHR